MKLLLDTHALIWWITGSPLLSKRATEAIRQTREVSYSLISFWEICLKMRKKKDNFPLTLMQLPTLRDEFRKDGLQELPILPEDCLKAAMLPLHHKDPWDRLIIATAQNEQFTIVTKDHLFRNYQADVLW